VVVVGGLVVDHSRALRVPATRPVTVPDRSSGLRASPGGGPLRTPGRGDTLTVPAP